MGGAGVAEGGGLVKVGSGVAVGGGGVGFVQAARDRTSRDRTSAMAPDLISTLRGKSSIAIIIARMGKMDKNVGHNNGDRPTS